jgi:hypothetical protein
MALAEQIQEIPYRIMILIPPAIALFAPVPNSVGGIPFLNGPAFVAFLSCILRRQFLVSMSRRDEIPAAVRCHLTSSWA